MSLNYQNLKEKSELQIQQLEKRNQDIQDLLVSNPATRPIMIEKTLESVNESFLSLNSAFGQDQEKAEIILNLESQIEDLQTQLKDTKYELENQISDLKEQLTNVKDVVTLELQFEFDDRKKQLSEDYIQKESELDEEIKILKLQMMDKEIDQTRFTEMNKALNDKLDINKEIDEIKEATVSQLKLKDDELQELRDAIGFFQKALEESRMREMNSRN